MEQPTENDKSATNTKWKKKLSIKAKIAALIGSAFLLFALVPYFWPSGPECGSQKTKKLLQRTAKQNQPNKFTDRIPKGQFFKYVAEDIKDLNDPGLSLFKSNLDNYFIYAGTAFDTGEIGRILLYTIMLDPDLEKYKNEWDESLESTIYTLGGNIITDSIDPQTKKIECQGELMVVTRFGSADEMLPVTFNVKVTSDGRHVMEIYGLN